MIVFRIFLCLLHNICFGAPGAELFPPMRGMKSTWPSSGGFQAGSSMVDADSCAPVSCDLALCPRMSQPV